MFTKYAELADDFHQLYDQLTSVRYVRGKNDYVIELTLPGMTKDTLRIHSEPEFDNDVLYIEGEGRAGKVSKCLYMPEHLNLEHAKASYEDGILTISIPWRGGHGPQEIPIS